MYLYVSSIHIDMYTMYLSLTKKFTGIHLQVVTNMNMQDPVQSSIQSFLY